MFDQRVGEAGLRPMYELAADDIEVLQARVAERLDVSRAAVSEMIRRLMEVSLVHLDGRAVSLTSAGNDQGATVGRHRLAERFLTDVLQMGLSDAHGEVSWRGPAVSAAVQGAHDRHRPATCPHGSSMPRSGHGRPTSIALSEAPVGERVHVAHLPERLAVNAGVLDQLERDGLVRGLTVSVIDRRDDDATLVRTGRGVIWVRPDVCAHLLVTVGDIDRITDELRGVPGDPPRARRE